MLLKLKRILVIHLSTIWEFKEAVNVKVVYELSKNDEESFLWLVVFIERSKETKYILLVNLLNTPAAASMPFLKQTG